MNKRDANTPAEMSDRKPEPTMIQVANRAISEKSEVVEHLKEGLTALAAFEHYCLTYQKHDISPRLKAWRDGAERLIGRHSVINR